MIFSPSPYCTHMEGKVTHTYSKVIFLYPYGLATFDILWTVLPVSQVIISPGNIWGSFSYQMPRSGISKYFFKILDCWKITIVLKDRYQEQNQLAAYWMHTASCTLACFEYSSNCTGEDLFIRGSLMHFRGSTMVSRQSPEKKIRKENKMQSTSWPW